MSQISFVSETVSATWNDKRLTPESLKALQTRKLSSLLAIARESVPFQKMRLNEINIARPELTQIEPTSKSQMMARFNDTIAAGAVTEEEVNALAATGFPGLPIIRRRYLVSMTSGTNGESGRFIQNLNDWAKLRGATFARTMRGRMRPLNLSRFAFGRRCRMAFLVTDCPYSASVHAAKTPMSLGRFYYGYTSVLDFRQCR